MSVVMHFPLDFAEQCEEIREHYSLYETVLGPASKDLDTEISNLIKVCDACYKMPEEEAEAILNSFVSILVINTDCDAFEIFCKHLESAPTPEMLGVAFSVMYNFFEGLPEDCLKRIDVYRVLLRIAGRTNNVKDVFQDIPSMKAWIALANFPVEKIRDTYRDLHQELLKSKMSDLALKVMGELLSTFSEKDAIDAKPDAERCIAANINDKKTFLMDHLLPLKPIKALEGQPIHNLLKIFISEKVSAYQDFYEKNKSLVDGLDLNHEEMVKKMRLLTFMMMAQNQREISFDDISRELGVKNVEEFAIDALKTKLVSAKINQITRKIIVISTMHRTFERTEWEKLRDALIGWNTRLEQVEQKTDQVIQAAAAQAVEA